MADLLLVLAVCGYLRDNPVCLAVIGVWCRRFTVDKAPARAGASPPIKLRFRRLRAAFPVNRRLVAWRGQRPMGATGRTGHAQRGDTLRPVWHRRSAECLILKQALSGLSLFPAA